MDANDKKYHGWRGSTSSGCLIAQRVALGVFEVLNIMEQKNGAIKIILSKDLHPDWE